MRSDILSSGHTDLFRERLDNLINPKHSLVRLADIVPWKQFDETFGYFEVP